LLAAGRIGVRNRKTFEKGRFASAWGRQERKARMFGYNRAG
jgi:hypothetical protein